MRYLLNTNVISEMMRGRPNQSVVAWMESLSAHSLYLSVITIGEIRKGIDKLTDPSRKAALETWFADEVIQHFENRILSLGVAEMLEWGTMVARAEKSGRSLSPMDSLIAALALHHECALVTRNDTDFAGLGFSVINPWIVNAPSS